MKTVKEMREQMLRYFKVNIEDYPIYLEVRQICRERYICFFSKLYDKDEFLIEDQFETFGFKVNNEASQQRFEVSGKLSTELAKTMWQQVADRLCKPDMVIDLYASLQ